MREGWKEVRLGEVSSLKSGKTKIESENGLYPIFGSNGIIGYSDNFNFENKIIIGRVGAYCGSIYYFKGKFWATDNTLIFAVDDNNDIVFWKYYLLRFPLNELAGGAAQPLLTQGLLNNLKFQLPPLETQKKIASILSGYDDLIENNLKRINILEEMAQQTYEEWFVRMRFPGHESATINPETGLPEGWEKVKLGDISVFKYGSMPKKDDIVESGFPVYSGYRITGFSKKFNISKKSLIVVARGVGGTGDVKFSPEKCWLTNLSILVNLNNNENINYLYYYLKAGNLRSLDSGAAQSQITIISLEPFPIVLPKIELIKRFNEIVEPIFGTIDILQNQNQRLREARDILLPRLMMGMIEV